MEKKKGTLGRGPLVGGGGPWWGHTTTEGNLYLKERVIWDCVPREHT